MSKKTTKEGFIAKAREVHGDKYNYDKVEYVNNDTKVTIVCLKHGEFHMTPHNHKAGQGCPECARENKVEALKKNAKSQRKTKEKFIKDAKAVHGDKYNYDKVEFVDTKTKVVITCPIHGDFPMTPNNHTSLKRGCPNCARERNKKEQTDTLEGFIAKSKEVHGDKYDYSKVIYVNRHTPVIITCPIHGDFPQFPTNHLSGSGCQKCRQSHLENEVMRLLEKNCILFDTQKKFPWLMSNKNYPMKLDFYLQEYNIAIECQGIQHYKANGFFTEERISYSKELDRLKYNLCKEHGIKLYYIRYNNIEKDTKNLLKIVNK